MPMNKIVPMHPMIAIDNGAPFIKVRSERREVIDESGPTHEQRECYDYQNEYD